MSAVNDKVERYYGAAVFAAPEIATGVAILRECQDLASFMEVYKRVIATAYVSGRLDCGKPSEVLFGSWDS